MPRTFLAGCLSAAAFALTASAAAPCGSLTSLALSHITVMSAKIVGAGEFTLPTPGRGPNPNAPFQKLPAFCKVTASLKPTADSDIRIEVWLPVAGWQFSVARLTDPDDAPEYWLSRPVEERLRALELLRRTFYGDSASEGLQRVLEVAQLEQR